MLVLQKVRNSCATFTRVGIMRTIAVASVLLSMSVTAHAQNGIDGNTCVALAKVIVAPIAVTLTERQTNAMRRYARCEASASASQDAIDVAYEAFTLGWSQSDENQHNSCEQSDTDFGYDETDYRQAAQYFFQSLPTIEKCLIAADDGWQFNYQPIPRDAISLGLSHTGETGGVIHGIDLLSSGTFTCVGLPETFPVTVLPTSPITMTCQREPTVTRLSGVEMTTSQDATVNFRLGSGPLPLTLPGYSSSVLDQINASVSAVENRVSDIDERMARYGEALGRWAGDVTPRKAGRSKADCPDGQYVAGIQGIDEDNGRVCAECLTHVQVFCRPLPRP